MASTLNLRLEILKQRVQRLETYFERRIPMNYLAHAYQYLSDPYFVAGTNLPDWLSVVDRKVRVRAKPAQLLISSEDKRTSRTAAGIAQHHWDDQWFHSTPIFQTLNLEFSVAIREVLSEQAGLRAGFLGHILVEILLDWKLAENQPGLLDEYYSVVETLDVLHLQQTVNRISKNPTDQLEAMVPRLVNAKFLYDYADDKKLLLRLNQVMRRVRLPELPDDLLDFFSHARSKIQDHWQTLITPPDIAFPRFW